MCFRLKFTPRFQFVAKIGFLISHFKAIIGIQVDQDQQWVILVKLKGFSDFDAFLKM